MIYGSVCSGIEAATVAWHPLGWRPAFFAEIEPFPKAVLAHHWPSVFDLGDFTQIGANRGPVDLLVGGTPCQSFSVSGRRGGLVDARGNLALEFLRLAAQLHARWILWENVPGILSSNGGRDFSAFLGALAEFRYGFAYRILDAQYFGVAQRRRRVFVVGHSGGLWQRAAAVLFERACLRGDPAPSRKAGSDVAGTPGARADKGERIEGNGALIAHTVTTREGSRMDPDGETYVTHTLRGEGFDASEDGTGRGTPLVPIPFDTTQITSPFSRARPEPGDPCHTLNRGSHPPSIALDTVRRLTPRECERLMGFPDNYTAIPRAKDGPRYRALGNSMVVPVMRWLGRRIQMIEDAIAAPILNGTGTGG